MLVGEHHWPMKRAALASSLGAMQIANPLVDVVRGCKCAKAGRMVACHDQTRLYLAHDVWLFRDTRVRVDYSCGCHAMLVEPRKWNTDHPEYNALAAHVGARVQRAVC